MKLLLCFLAFSLYGVDYDCVFIGSSPISLFEALYQYSCGKKVLIIDESPTCGGVWKSIDICGIEHVDVGCHEIGNNNGLKEFLEEYAGCQMIYPLDKNRNFYFSKGCYELIRNLEKMIANTSIDLLVNTRAERAILDEEEKCVVIETRDQKISTQKIYQCGYSFINIGEDTPRLIHKSKYYHLYLLIADSTEPRFAYQNSSISGTSRMMNLTHFLDLQQRGQQLIVFQAHNESGLNEGERLLNELKKKGLVDGAAYILRSEPYIYEQWPLHLDAMQEAYRPYFEFLKTQDFRNMTNYFKQWKQGLHK